MAWSTFAKQAFTSKGFQMRTVQKAVKTLKAIEDAIAADQGAAYRQHLQRVLPHIGDAYRGHDDPFRTHLGCWGIRMRMWRCTR